MPRTDSKGRAKLLPADALAAGWRSWIGMVIFAAGGMIVVLSTQSISGQASEGGTLLAGKVVIGVAIVWLLLLGGVVLILRSYCFRALWDGRPVEAGSYLKGMYQVWGVLTFGGLLGVLGALLMGAILPGGLVALGALMLLVFARPSGKALGV